MSDLNSELVYHADIVIFGIIIVFTLASLPRAYARFSRRINLNYNIPPVDHEKPSFVEFDNTASSTACASLPSLPQFALPNDKALPVTPIHLAPLLYSTCLSPSQIRSRTLNELVGTLPLKSVSYMRWLPRNIIGMMVGVGYEKLNFFTAWLVALWSLVGMSTSLAMSVNGASPDDIYEKLADDYVRRGIVALVCLDILGFCSTEFVRSKSYNLFIATHVATPIVFLFTACYHEPACVPYIIAACVFYIFGHVIRAVKTRITTARPRPLPELGITRVEVPSLNSGWRAGQHVRLRVLSSSMGWWGWTEVHPFTIANVTQTSEGMVLMCKRTGRWTNSPFSMAQTASYGETGKDVGRDVRVIVEGPYGGVGHTVMSSYSGAMFVVGGSGVSFALSAVQDLIQAATDVKVIDIVLNSPSSRIRVHIFYTRAISTTFNGMYLQNGITLLPGRPKLDKLLDAAITDTMSAGGNNGVFVGVCGFVSLANTTVRVVKESDIRLRTAVGGVELHEETFGW
ncbi:hypothetical protein DFH29DRAFT_1003688 [Suillus ampliporus]|nr:hypothetical protein DFH29DRAFT_1003688 [Suillus ampliporus]